jgi:hypothetical protein
MTADRRHRELSSSSDPKSKGEFDVVTDADVFEQIRPKLARSRRRRRTAKGIPTPSIPRGRPWVQMDNSSQGPPRRGGRLIVSASSRFASFDVEAVLLVSSAHLCRSHRKLIVVLFTPPADGGGLGASSAPPIQRTHPTPNQCSSPPSPPSAAMAA